MERSAWMNSANSWKLPAWVHLGMQQNDLQLLILRCHRRNESRSSSNRASNSKSLANHLCMYNVLNWATGIFIAAKIWFQIGGSSLRWRFLHLQIVYFRCGWWSFFFHYFFRFTAPIDCHITPLMQAWSVRTIQYGMPILFYCGELLFFFKIISTYAPFA